MTAARLREILAAPGTSLFAGCYDGVSARLVNRAGFVGAHMSGFAVSASLLGEPDLGLLTFSEMVDAVGRLSRLLDAPLLADGDTGYGNEDNVARTIELYARAGSSGIHLEDQVMPKRCGHLPGKELIPAEEMRLKIRAAVAERDRGSDLVIVARTDALSVEGLDAAIERARRYRDSGADALFVEGLGSVDEAATVATALTGTPLVCNLTEARAPVADLGTLSELGFAVALAPITTLLSSASAMAAALDRLQTTGPSADLFGQMMSYDDLLDLVGFSNNGR